MKDKTYCSIYDCRYAEFPKEDRGAANSCRTFDVLYCSLLEQHVKKNQKCEANSITTKK